jgi:uroporphyrinogen decarboxylase
METSRDRVLKAINHNQPKATPLHIMTWDPVDPWLNRLKVANEFQLRDALGLDIREARPVYHGVEKHKGRDIWGNRIGTVSGARGAGYSSVSGYYPLAGAETLRDIEGFAWPDPEAFDFDIVAEALQNTPEDKARMVKIAYGIQNHTQPKIEASRSGGPWIPLLCTLFDLFGMERALINLHLAPKLIEAAIAYIEDFTLGFAERLLNATKGLADILWYGDDFAGQQGMLISPSHWRRFLKPSYSKVYQLAHRHGLKLWIHECGTFRPVLPDMIEMGMQVWETTQVHLTGNEPAVLKREYGSELTFFGAINTQETLPFGTRARIRNEVRERVRALGGGGGYICGPDHTVMEDIPFDNIMVMLDEARRTD